jgi:hypothetical protein
MALLSGRGRQDIGVIRQVAAAAERGRFDLIFMVTTLR